MPLRKQLILPSPSYRYNQTEHFLGNSATGYGTGIISAGAGTGAAATQVAGQANSPGVVRLTTGTTTTGYWSLRYPSVFSPPGNTGKQNYRVSFRWRVPATTSTTESCTWTLGFSDATAPGEPSNGAYVYVDSIEGYIYFATAKAGVRSYSAAIDLLTPNVWVESSILLAKNGTVKFTSQASEDAPFYQSILSTNVPTVSLGVVCGLIKSAGTTARNLDIDYISIDVDRETPILSVY